MADGAGPTIARYDLDAEAVCLSRAIESHDAALELIELLDESDYWADANRHIHRAIQSVCARGDAVDLAAVIGELRATNRFNQVGGSAYLATIGVAPWGNLAQHARTIQGLARVRRALDAFRELVAEGQVSEITDVDAWLDTCERRAYDATASKGAARQTACTYAETRAILHRGWDEAEASQDRTWGVSTGFSRLDEHTMGMRPGQLWYVGARPGQGKTAFAQQIAEYIAERGGGGAAAIIASMEMSRDELIIRATSRRAGVSHRRITRRALEHDLGVVLQASEGNERLPIAIDEQKSLSPVQLRAKVRRLTALLRGSFPSAALKLVVVDYVQLMSPDRERKNGTRAQELGEISKSLKALAGDFECTVLALSQLTRPEKGKAPPPPTLFDFRDSGAIEADGDVVIGLHRMDQYRGPGAARDGICEVHVLKGRGCGEAGFQLLFDGPTTKFTNVHVEDDRLWERERE